MSLGKVVVLYGGYSSEREVSLMSGRGVYEALLSEGVDAHLFDPKVNTLEELIQGQYDRAFIALHGLHGEDGVIQGVLEYLKIPYTGSGLLGSSIGMDKCMTKYIWRAKQLPMPRDRVVKTLEEAKSAYEELGQPMILKAPSEGSSLGVYKIESLDMLETAWQDIQHYDREFLAEQFIHGRELTVAILGQGDDAQALPVVEIVAPDGSYDYDNKYKSNDTKYYCPANLPEDLSQHIQSLCLTAYQAVHASGWARIDVLLDDDQPYLLEINTSPGMTSHSLVPMAAKEIGYTYPKLCVFLLEQARLNRV